MSAVTRLVRRHPLAAFAVLEVGFLALNLVSHQRFEDQRVGDGTFKDAKAAKQAQLLMNVGFQVRPLSVVL